jgi:hypothetical protein
MDSISFTSYLINGKFLAFSKETSELDIIKELGEPLEIEDYGSSGKFFHYENFRLSLNKNLLEYIDIFFINTDLEFKVDLGDKTIAISEATPLLEILHVLNYFGVKWEIVSEKSKFDYLNVDLNNGLLISYYYGNGHLERITCFLK